MDALPCNLFPFASASRPNETSDRRGVEHGPMNLSSTHPCLPSPAPRRPWETGENFEKIDAPYKSPLSAAANLARPTFRECLHGSTPNHFHALLTLCPCYRFSLPTTLVLSDTPYLRGVGAPVITAPAISITRTGRNLRFPIFRIPVRVLENVSLAHEM